MNTPATHDAHQKPYIAQLRPINPAKFKGKADDDEADPDLHSDFMSLLGGLAWTIQTKKEGQCLYTSPPSE